MIGFAVYAKANELLRPGRLMLYVLIQAVLIVIPSTFGFFAFQFIPYGLIFVQVAFFLFGILGVYFTTTASFASIGFEEKRLPLVLAILVSLLLGTWGFFLLFEFISNLGYSLWVSLTSLWFLLPFFFHWGKQEYLNTPPAYYQIFDPLDYRSDDSALWDDVDYLRLMNISLRIRHKPTDKAFSSYPVKAPGEIPIASWFTRYMKDHRVKFPNAPIETEDGGEPYCWIFYTTRFFIFNRPISPEKTFDEYRIRQNSIVYVRRIEKEVSIL